MYAPLAQDNLLETERQKSNALSTRMEALTRSHQIESEKAEQAMVALKHRRKQFRDHQLKRVLLRLLATIIRLIPRTQRGLAQTPTC